MATQLRHHYRTTTLTSDRLPVPRLRRALRINALSSGGAGKLIESGAIKAIRPKDAGAALESGSYVMLDVRPVWEREKARVAGSVHVRLLVEGCDMGPVTLLKKWVHFGYIGLWTGQKFTTLNDNFLGQVKAAVPDRETKLLVACSEGLR